MLTFVHFIVLALGTQLPYGAHAQDPSTKVWGVYAYTVFGDSTPNALAEIQPKILSEYGASQLSAVGSAFRNRYVTSSGGNQSDTGIQYISPSILETEDVNVYSTTDQYAIASAQAFMIGLYPPLEQLNMNRSDEVANGTKYTAPLGGYQFPRIVTLGKSNPGSLAISGQAECTMYDVAESEYQNSAEAQKLSGDSQSFYSGLWDKVLSGTFDQSSAVYTNALDIAEYLDYEYLHNETASEYITNDDLRQARYLADRYSYATNGEGASTNQSSFGTAGPIAGQTLASSILSTFRANIEERGAKDKMKLLFGEEKTAVALASQIGLANPSASNFFSRPVRGASLVFELYSFESDIEYPSYPSSDQLYVRFFLHNGTDSSTEFTSYPLFGHGPSQTYIPWNDFEEELETFAVQSISEWCIRCNADSIFCGGALGNDKPTSKKGKGVSPAVAGVIGAVVTLAVIALLAVLGIFLPRVFRKRKDRQASTGGFKGMTKMASDTDVSFQNPIWGATKTSSSQKQQEVSTTDSRGHGHERLGSWEMNEHKAGLDGSPPTTTRGMHAALGNDQDDLEIHSGLQPVREHESI